MKSLFDTNAFRDVERGIITPQQVRRVWDRTWDGIGSNYVCPVTLIELGSHITEGERGNFPTYQAAFRAIRAFRCDGLPDPEWFMREKVFGVSTLLPAISGEETRDLCLLVASAKNYEAVYQSRLLAWHGSTSMLRWNEPLPGDKTFLASFREDTENGYIQRMFDSVIAVFIPDYTQKKAAGLLPMMDDAVINSALGTIQRSFALEHLESPEFVMDYVRSQGARCGVDTNGWDAHRIWNTLLKMEAYFEVYKSILRSILTAGYNFERRKNDFNDIHYLLYLADPDIEFVTRDAGFLNKLPDSCQQKSRIIPSSQWF